MNLIEELEIRRKSRCECDKTHPLKCISCEITEEDEAIVKKHMLTKTECDVSVRGIYPILDKKLKALTRSEE